MHHEIDGFGELKRPVTDKLLMKAKKCLYLAFCFHAVGIYSKSPSVPEYAISAVTEGVYKRFLESHEEILGHQIIAIEDAFYSAIRERLKAYPETASVIPLDGLGKALFPESFK